MVASFNPSCRRLISTLICVAVLYLLLISLSNNNLLEHTPTDGTPGRKPLISSAKKNEWDSINFVSSPPTTSFRKNLRTDTSYITAWCMGGFTNLFIGSVNMIYLGLISDRVPIVPPFAPSHHICRYSHFNYNGLADQISARAAGVVSMGEIFDMVHLRDTLRSPVLEWSDVKDLTGPTSDSDNLGCWSARSRADEDPSGAENLLAYLKLDVAYTRVPDSMFRSSREGDVFTNTWPLVSLVFPGGPERQTSVWKKTSSGIEVRPDRQLACFDSLYYMGTGVEEYEWQQAWGPAWRQVGRNLKFSSKMVELAETYARNAIGVAENATLPPFIAVHIRHGDFEGACSRYNATTIKECLAPLSAFVRRVQQVKDDLLEGQGIDVHEVVVSSDERDPKFWREIVSLGWKYNDHDQDKTEARYGEWYPPIIDVAVHSLAHGFVGTDQSTLSLISQYRVRDWNKGPTRLVMWGFPGADDI